MSPFPFRFRQQGPRHSHHPWHRHCLLTTLHEPIHGWSQLGYYIFFLQHWLEYTNRGQQGLWTCRHKSSWEEESLRVALTHSCLAFLFFFLRIIWSLHSFFLFRHTHTPFSYILLYAPPLPFLFPFNCDLHILELFTAFATHTPPPPPVPFFLFYYMGFFFRHLYTLTSVFSFGWGPYIEKREDERDMLQRRRRFVCFSLRDAIFLLLAREEESKNWGGSGRYSGRDGYETYIALSNSQRTEEEFLETNKNSKVS